MPDSSFTIHSLAELTTPGAPIVYGIVQPGEQVDDGVPFVQSRDVGGEVDVLTLQRTAPEVAAAYRRSTIRVGDILFSLRGQIGQSSLAKESLAGANIARGIARIRVALPHSPEFVRYALQSPRLLKQIAQDANGSTFKELTIDALRNLPIPVPAAAEQRKIAEMLRAWDDAIDKLQTLRATTAKLTSAIADDLIFGLRRVAGRTKAWPLRRLAEVTQELTRRNRDGALGREVVMGVTNSRGIVPMREQTIAADISRYLVLPPRAFAYNPMRINVGSIAMSRFEHDVLVSPDYVLFECTPGNLDPDFLDHLRQSHFWSHYINAGGTGSVRMRTYYDDLAALRLKLPPYDEQLAISEVLNTAKRELVLIQNQIEAVTRQKRGLMQKLLTGEWRVKVEGDEGVAA